VVVQLLIVVSLDIATRKHGFDVRQKLRVDGHHVFEVPVIRAILNHPNLAVAFDNLRFDLTNLLVDQNRHSCLPLRMFSRASITQFGHNESVTLGQPSVGFVFCQDFSSGLSDHFGVKDGLGLYLLTTWMALNRPPATIVSPRSACLIAFI
jgi:hypothetical protein